MDLTFLELRSRFLYSTTDWETTIPVRPWDRRTSTVGGQKIAAGGTPGAYIVRRDHVVMVPLRFRETEWTDVHAMIAWGQSGETLLWYPDALAATFYEVYLASPVAGEDIAPSRSSDYPKMLEITVGLRKVDGTPWSLDYYGNL